MTGSSKDSRTRSLECGFGAVQALVLSCWLLAGDGDGEMDPYILPQVKKVARYLPFFSIPSFPTTSQQLVG